MPAPFPSGDDAPLARNADERVSPDADEPLAPDIDEAGVDRAQIRAMLDLSPEARLRVMEEFVNGVLAIREANEKGRVR